MTDHIDRIVLVDLSERDLRVRVEMQEKVQRLKVLKEKSGITAVQELEIEKYEDLLERDEVIDPFYRAVRESYLNSGELNAGVLLHKHGLIKDQNAENPGGSLGDREIEISAICGLMQLDGFTDPERSSFQKKMSMAQGEYRTNTELFIRVFNWLSARHLVSIDSQIRENLIFYAIVGCIVPTKKISDRRIKGTLEIKEDAKTDPKLNDKIHAVSTKSAANVVRKLVADRITDTDPFLGTKIEAAFESTTGVHDTGLLSSIEIMLPDLEEAVDVEIVKENLDAVQAIYFFMMLEEARLPQVVDYISDAWRRGAITLGRGTAGDALYKYHRTAPERLNEVERRNFYMGTFGTPGGDPAYGRDNALFYELMLRTTSSVSNYFRKFSTDNIFLSQETIRKACRELAANLSVNGYGMAHYTAGELQQTIVDYRDLLSNPDVLRVFGARDMWQVVDQINANYLGGLRNTYRYRIQAHSGAIVIRWLANHHDRLVGRSGADVISTDVLRSPHLREITGNKPLVTPNDWDFVNACEQWLAVGGVQEESVNQYSQPIESPAIPSRPIGMPQVAQDVLHSVGIELPNM